MPEPQQTERAAIFRLYDAVLDIPSHIDIIEHNTPRAVDALMAWASAHGYDVRVNTYEKGDTLQHGYTVVGCDPGTSRAIRVFK